MKGIRKICVLSLVGVFACVEQAAAPVPASEESELEAAELEAADNTRVVESNLFVCCSEYSCPGTGDEYGGCTRSSQTPTLAMRACNAACSATCLLLYSECFEY